MARERYRIALVVDSPRVPRWVVELVQWAAQHPRIELVAIIIIDKARRPRGAAALIERAERRLLALSGTYRAYGKRYPIGGRAPVDIDMDAAGSREAKFAEIAALNLDALVCCLGAPCSADIAGQARDGTLSLVLGAGVAQDGGFSEVLQGRPETPFAIELQRPSGTREILSSGSIATALFHRANLIGLNARLFPYLQVALERLASGTAAASDEVPAPTVNRPRSTDIIAYGARTAKRSIGKAARRLLGREFNWQVGVSWEAWPGVNWSDAFLVPNPDGAFLADPFTVERHGEHYLFVEEFPFATRKGVISAFGLERGNARRLGVALERHCHLSFPFQFEFAGERFMVPESGADRSVRLYRSTDFPLGWKEEKILLEGVHAVDTILFEHDSLWWMLTTIAGKGPALNNAELHAFYAADPFGEWRPHALNPVLIDSRKGRNGGFLRDAQGRPCRVAQVPGFTFYGASSAIYRIDEISPSTYRETLIEQVLPTFLPRLDGTHHVHSEGGVTVFDFMRVERPPRPRER